MFPNRPVTTPAVDLRHYGEEFRPADVCVCVCVCSGRSSSSSKLVVSCAMVKNLESNYAMWAKIIEDTAQHSEDAADVDVPASSSVSVCHV